jgi:hypothetical protein
MNIYDENNNCIECMEYFYDPHQPDCKYSDVCGICDCKWESFSKSLAIHSEVKK